MLLQTSLKRSDSFKMLTFLSLLYFALLLASMLFTKKLFAFPAVGALPLSLFISPFLFILADIIAEVYGYRISRTLIIASVIVFALFGFSTTWLSSLSSPASLISWSNIQDHNAFSFMFGNLYQDTLGVALSFVLSTYINIYFLLKWKILLKGRYFWLRSIGASCIALIIWSTIACLSVGYKTLLDHQITFFFKVLFVSILIKFLVCIIMAFPANLICIILKWVEGIDTYDQIQFNPFKHHSAT